MNILAASASTAQTGERVVYQLLTRNKGEIALISQTLRAIYIIPVPFS